MKKFPYRPEPLAMWLHYGMVYAIDQGHPQAAETFSRAIIAEYQQRAARTIPCSRTPSCSRYESWT